MMTSESESTRPLSGKTALVTGASKGIGLAIARALAGAGADVCLTARSADLLEEARAGMTGGRRTMAITLDVADRAACFAAIAATASAWGGVDILVNAAASYRTASFLETRIEDYERTMAVNLYGAIHMMHAALPGMLGTGFGRIINIASAGGRTGSPNQSAYNVSKHGLIGLTRCVAIETARQGITVNAICPGLVDTEMFDQLVAGQGAAFGVPADKMRGRILAGQSIGRLIAPDEVASLAVYLAFPAAAGLTGQSILYDGGTLFG